MRSTLGHIPRFIAIAICFIAMLLVANLSPTSAQPSPETWMDLSEDPDIGYGDIYSAEEYLQNHRITQSVIGTRQHEEKSFPIINGSSYTQDWYESSLGYFGYGGQGYVPAGEQEAGFMENFGSLVFPTMNESVLLEQFTDGTNKAQLRKGSATDATILKDAEGMMPNFWIWKNPPSLELNYEDGSPYNLDDNALYSQVVYSFNGRWMIIWDMRGFVIRIDLEDLKISTYRIVQEEKSEYAALAISDSGRYIAVYVHGGAFTMLDTQGCTKLLGYIAIPEGDIQCKTKNMHDYSQEYFQDLSEANLEFYNEWLLRIRGMNTRHGTGDEIIVRAPKTRLRSNYIALGDSYSSGEGAYSYLRGTDDPNNRCHISSRSYPFLLKDWLRLDSTHSVACSGARMHNIAGGHINDAAQNKKRPSNTSLGKWLPGYKWQIEHIKDPSNPVDIVTIGISGNDIGFADKLVACVKPGNCFGSTYDRIGVALEINYQFDKLSTLFSSVRSQAIRKSPTARVYAVGYPQIFDATGSYKGRCGANVRLSYEEVLMAYDLISYLNKVIKSAAARAGVVYIDIGQALKGYELCGKSHTKAINGITVGDGAGKYYTGPFAIESFHPNHFGHTLIAATIRSKSSGFNTPLPRPDKLVNAPDPLRNTLVGNASDMPNDVRRLIYGGEISSDLVIKGSSQYLFLDGSYKLRAGTKAVLVYRSNPTLVGEYTVSTSGSLEVTYTVPDSIDPGIHTLHILGENFEGEKVDIYKTVYIAHSTDDWDGDGLPNSQEPCGVLDPAFSDEDFDGIDDGCDSQITLNSRSELTSTSRINSVSRVAPFVTGARIFNSLKTLHSPTVEKLNQPENYTKVKNNSHLEFGILAILAATIAVACFTLVAKRGHKEVE